MTTTRQFQLKPRQLTFVGTLICLIAFLIGLGSEKANAQSNDECINAISVTCGSVTAGSTIGMNPDDVPVCFGIELSPQRGVWYTYEGTGAFVTLSTCNPNTDVWTRIRVFKGSCAELVCVAGNNDYTCSNYTRAEVGFNAMDGTTYWILVESLSGVGGNFELSVDCGPFVQNDLCDGATPVTCGSVTTGSTVGLNADDAPECGGVANSIWPGVWYSFEGTGEYVRFSTCGSSAYFNTRIRVYTGSCTDLECVTGNDNDQWKSCYVNSVSFFHSRVDFFSEPGTTYWILVDGTSMPPMSGSGSYVLSVDCVPQAPNDVCESATPVTCGSVTTGNTVRQGNDTAPGCFVGDGGPGGVWYSFIGTGELVRLSTCPLNIYFRPRIRVYTGSCTDLECVAGNAQGGSSNGIGYCATVEFLSEEGTTYWILVHGDERTDELYYSEGPFELSVSCVPQEPNDVCEGAIPVTCGSVIAGTTLQQTIDKVPGCCPRCGAYQYYRGVWYSFEGTGEVITLTTCSPTPNTGFSVWKGSCASLICFNRTSTGLCQALTFQSEVGTTYLILVYGSNNGGSFELSVTSNTDTDGDGTADCIDGCPLDPNKTEAGACGCGVVDTDTDGDSIADCVDTDDDNDGCLDDNDTNPLVYSEDADCDGVHNDCDVCPGGDDNGPCNATSLPPLNSLPPSWLCSNNGNNEKIKVCHEGTTLCVSESAAATHLAHGDFLGPCASCQENAPPPAGGGKVSDRAALAATSSGFELVPNPASSKVTVVLKDMEGAATLSVFDALGREIALRPVKAGVVRFELDLPESQFPAGNYFIRLTTGNEVRTRVLAVQR